MFKIENMEYAAYVLKLLSYVVNFIEITVVNASDILFIQRENSCQCKVIPYLCKEKIVVYTN
jgi:hypothetical protein